MLSTAKKPRTGELPEDLGKLFEEHASFVFHVAYRITGRKEEAEDIVQGVFLRMLRSGRTADLARNPKGYLYRAAVNMGLDILRRERRNDSSDEMDGHESTAPGADREYRSAEIHAWFRVALSKLSPAAAEMFVLKHLEGYDNREIAQMLGTTRGTVAVTLFRSRISLKRSIERFLGRK